MLYVANIAKVAAIYAIHTKHYNKLITITNLKIKSIKKQILSRSHPGQTVHCFGAEALACWASL